MTYEFAKAGDDETKMVILRAIDRSLDELTVEEICAKAGISRQRFYRNFSSKYDIFTWHAIRVEEKCLDHVGRTVGWEVGYTHHFNLLALERAPYTAGLQYTGRALFGTDPMPAHRKEVLLETLREWSRVELTDELLFCVEAFTKLETELADQWFRSGLPDPDGFAKKMAATVPHLLYEATEISLR